MARNLSPVRRELENLDKDADRRRSAMKALTSYVKDLDSGEIPLFLAQVSETKSVGSSSREDTASLYEVLARVHGPKIIPYINSIMGAIIQNLATSAGSLPLQQACSKVAPVIARYAIEPTASEDKKKYIIHSLCKPFSDSLSNAQESLSSGAALCLKSLVDCENWRFAPDEMVNEVCLKLAVALEEKTTQTSSHLGLVMSLAKHNSLTVEAYAGIFVRCGLEILNSGAVERNSQKRLTAIHMINSLMKCLDVGSISSELELIIVEMEKCQSDQARYVQGAAFEALETARELASTKGPKFDADAVSTTSSSCGGGRHHFSPARSRTPDPFPVNCSFAESPISAFQASSNADNDRKNGSRRKLWTYDSESGNISLKNGFYSEFANGGASHSMSEHHEASDSRRSNRNGGFHGFYPETPTREGFRSQTPSPQRMRPRTNSSGVKIYRTPDKPLHFFEDEECETTTLYSQQARNVTSPSSVKCGCSQATTHSSNGLPNGLVTRANVINLSLTDRARRCPSSSESVSSTEDVPNDAQQPSQVMTKHQEPTKKERAKTALNVWYVVFLLLFSVVLSVVWLGGEDRLGPVLVPT